MVEPTAQEQKEYGLNIDAAQSLKRIVLTIGDSHHGKSTFSNALIGAPKNKTSDGTTGGKQDFSIHNSIIPELTDTIIIDSPALNDS